MNPGEWKVLPVGTEILAVHAALVRTRHRPELNTVQAQGRLSSFSRVMICGEYSPLKLRCGR
jgi:hypothetical protein